MPALARNVEALYWGRQVAQGTPVASPTKRGLKVSGDFNIQREDGQENASDGERFSNTATFTSTLQGGGTVGIQAQPGIVGSLAALMLGSDTATGTLANDVQTVTSTGTSGSYKLLYTGLASVDIAFNATSAVVQAALERVANVGKGNVTVTGAGGGPYTVTFVNEAGNAPHAVLTADNTNLVGGTASVVHTTTGVAKTHTIVPGAESFYTTMWKSLGTGSVVQRQKYNDCRISGLSFQAGRNQMVGRVSPTVLSLDPGEVIAADPSLAQDIDRPMIYTEVEGTVKLNGVVFRGIAGFTVNCTDELAPWYGDTARVHEVVSGRGEVQLNDATILVDNAGLALYNEMYYGTPNPAVASKPLVVPPAPGSFEFNLWRFNTSADPGRQIKVELPNVLWNPPESPSGDPEGGPPEVSFSGRTRKVGSDPHVRFTVRSGDNASYTA